MKKTLLAMLMTIGTGAMAVHPSGNEPWKWKMTSEAEQATLHIDLYEESVDVPGMDMFGPMNGYLGGKGIYGVWMVTSYKIENEKTATLRLSNDLGSETQKVKLTLLSDSTCQFEMQGTAVIKRAVNRKLVKIPTSFLLKR